MKKVTKRFKKRVAVMLASAILLGGANNTPVLARDKGDGAKGNYGEGVSDENDLIAWDNMTTESDYCGNGFRVKFILKEYWAGGYNAEVKIYNTGDETIENWVLGFDYNDDISNIWNAKIVENTDNDEIDKKEDQDLKPVVIKNAVWNQDIPAGEYVEFGFSGKGDFVGFPGKYHMLGEMQLADPKDYDIEYKLSSDWGSGYNSSIEIINNTDGDIEDWILEFDYEREITNIWNGTIESHEENHYVIKNSGYNSNIYAGKKIDFGFSGNSGSKEMLPSGYELYYYDITKEKSENKEEKHRRFMRVGRRSSDGYERCKIIIR